MDKKIPIEWLIETLDARLNPYSEEMLDGVVRKVIEDLVIMGLIDEDQIEFAKEKKKGATGGDCGTN